MGWCSFLSGVIIKSQATKTVSYPGYLYCVYTFQIDEGQSYYSGVSAAGQQFVMSYVADLAMDRNTSTIHMLQTSMAPAVIPTGVPTLSPTASPTTISKDSQILIITGVVIVVLGVIVSIVVCFCMKKKRNQSEMISDGSDENEDLISGDEVEDNL